MGTRPLIFAWLLPLLIAATDQVEVAPHEWLAKAREAHRNNDLDGAARFYNEIKFGDSVWPNKVIDFARINILRRKPQEAFRMMELLRTTDVAQPESGYYRALAFLLAKGCAAELPVENARWKALMNAHILRFNARYRSREYSGAPLEQAIGGVRQNHLGAKQFHALADIADIRVLAGQGCRLYGDRLKDPVKALHHEFVALREFHMLGKMEDFPHIAGEEQIRPRLLALALKEPKKDDELISELITYYKDLPLADWYKLHGDERRFLFKTLLAKEVYPKPPIPADNAGFAFVINMIKNIPPKEGVIWLDLLDWKQVSVKDREEILDHFLSDDGLNARPMCLMARAELYAQASDPTKALGIVRQLLINGESNGDMEVEQRAIDLGTQIFSEYRYDPRLLGGIQAALPSTLWPRVFRPVLIDESLTGHGERFETAMAVLTKAGRVRSLGFTEDDLTLLRALGARNGGAVEKIMRLWLKDRRLNNNRMTFLALLSERMIGLKDADFVGLQSFSTLTAEILKEFLERGQNDERTQELFAFFRTASSEEFIRGNETVRQGLVKAGTVNIRDDHGSPIQVKWTAPDQPNLRELLVMPVTAVGRDWAIQ